jgi:hypothetical protein
MKSLYKDFNKTGLTNNLIFLCQIVQNKIIEIIKTTVFISNYSVY